MIVVDASLAAKWLLEEKQSSDALDFLSASNATLAGPDLILVEVAGAIVRRANMRTMSSMDAEAALDKWTVILTSGALTIHATTVPRLNEAARLALTLIHPIKDCIYLALAIAHDAELVTCDARFIAKAKPLHAKVRHLTEIASGQGPSSPE